MREAKDKTSAEREAMADKEVEGDDGAQTPPATDEDPCPVPGRHTGPFVTNDRHHD